MDYAAFIHSECKDAPPDYAAKCKTFISTTLLSMTCISFLTLGILIFLPRESVAIEEPNAFFPLLDAITNSETWEGEHSARDAHQHVFDTALALDYLAQPGAYVAAEMHVALHSASPKLEAYYQYYNDHYASRHVDRKACGSWVDWYGEVVCDAKTLVRFVGTEFLDAPKYASENAYVHHTRHILCL